MDKMLLLTPELKDRLASVLTSDTRFWCSRLAFEGVGGRGLQTCCCSVERILQFPWPTKNKLPALRGWKSPSRPRQCIVLTSATHSAESFTTQLPTYSV